VQKACPADPNGLKVHGVAYTKEQVSAQGWTLVF
jgi:hypothetical protein